MQETDVKRQDARVFWWLLPAAALLVALPLWLGGGCSCGHDFQFHLESWLEAARQLRHGVLYPAWAVSPAWNAGEPRFVFYPPLSWMAGALLTLVLPFGKVPAVYTTAVFIAAALSMYACARRFVQPAAAALAAALYVANPYMLFTAFERTAFAELLAAVWMPWLLAALLRERPTVASISVPLALLWLTNAPAGVMGSYTVAVLGLWRLATMLRRRPSPATASAGSRKDLRALLPTAGTLLVGAGLGLALAAVYLLPAAYERRFVEIQMAVVPGLSFPKNFLFGHTSDPVHDHVLRQASTIAVVLLAVALMTLMLALVLRKRGRPLAAEPLAALAVLTLAIGFLLEPASGLLWMDLPELAFLQFPWRWLAVLSVADAFLLAFVFSTLRRRGLRSVAVLALCSVVLFAFPTGRLFLQPCPAAERPQAVADLLRTSHGAPPTDEYTPLDADNDELRSDDPAWWLLELDNADAPAPGTVPNPNAAAPDVDFGPPAVWATVSAPAPHQLSVDLPRPEVLVLNLRAYPNWEVEREPATGAPAQPAVRVERTDGLLALKLPAGPSTVHVRWRTGRDREAGLALSGAGFLALLLLRRRSRAAGGAAVA